MKNLFFAINLLFALLSGVTTPLAAQDQSGSVAIASAIKPPTQEVAVDKFTACVSSLKKDGMKPETAAKECNKIIKIVAHTTERVANEAADATKASRPMLIESCCGYGYGSYGYRSSYYGGGYYNGGYYNRPMYREPPPTREVPRREPPPAREAPKR